MNPLSMTLPLMNDTSVVVLNQITGVVDYFISGDPKDINHVVFAKMLLHFNQALLGFGLIIFAILLFVGTMNTAADGQFLGKNWNSVWTPLRLVFGVLFVVPLKTGLCFGQYIFLYLILLGVHIGTYVWNQVIDDVFNNYTPPAIPSYVSNYALQAVEGQLILMSVNEIQQTVFGVKPGSTSTIPQTVNNSYTIGSSSMPSAIISVFSQQIPGICSSLFTDQGIQNSCVQAVNNVLAGGTTQNGQAQSNVTPDLGGAITVWIGANLTPSSVGLNPNDPNGFNFNSPSGTAVNGVVTVTGTYSYTFANEATPELNGGNNGQNPTGLAPTDYGLGGSIQNSLIPIVAAKIMNVSSPPSPGGGYPDLCENDPSNPGVSCALNSITDSIISSAQTAIEELNNPNTQCSNTGNSNTPNCGITPGLKYYTINGMSYLDANDQVVTGPPILIPLKGSWWNAGEAYLILDDVFSQNLQKLIDAIQQNILNFSSDQNVTGSLTATTNIMISEAGAEYQSASSGLANTGSQSFINQCAQVSTNSYVCGMGSMMLASPQSLTGITTDLNMTDIGASGSWGGIIAPYNPDLTPTTGLTAASTPSDEQVAQQLYTERVPGTTEGFYNELINVPVSLQAPIELLLALAQQNQGQPPCKVNNNPTGNCYITVYPYLSNLINVLAENGLLSQSVNVLPLNQAMNDMFTQLLGAQDANDPRIYALSSVMQDVYNLGDAPPGSDLISQQFSLVQQVRNVGIGMIVACLGSINAVYNHYTETVNGLLQGINNKLSGPEASAAWGLAGGAAALYTSAAGVAFMPGATGFATGLGFLAQAASTASQVLQTQVELAVTTLTITTLTNMAIQMLWLPVFVFVMVSLFTAGVQFALLIPFMPYIMFWAGQIAWVIGVLEALVAAPLVMLAFAHPGGNDYVGHAAPAVRFLIGVIFRPVLMVIGMVVGILLTYVLINYSAQGFHVIADSVFNAIPATNITLSGVMSCLLLFAYASFLVMAFTKCFSPIYVIPEKVVQWINGHAERAGEQEAQQFGSNVQQSAQSGAQAGGQALQQGAQAQQQRGQQMSDLEQKQYSQGLMMTSATKASEAGKDSASSSITFNTKKNES